MATVAYNKNNLVWGVIEGSDVSIETKEVEVVVDRIKKGMCV